MAKEKTIDDVFEAIEQLAITTKKGFDGVDERFNTIDERFNDVDVRFNIIEKNLFAIDSKIESIDKRLESIEQTLGPLVQVSGAMQHEIRELNLRVSKLEHKAGLTTVK